MNKTKNLKYLSVIIVILFISAIPFINFEILRIKSYLNGFEEVNNFILKNLKNGNEISFPELKKKINKFPILNQAIRKSELCDIIYYQSTGIIYKFQCENNSSDNFIDSDDKYYLIKILNRETKLLNYAQFIDYSQKPIELKNNWYLIEQNIMYD
ncbi:hypothetical protein RRF68_04870 [Tenacibaculum sp. HL-MS23]|uniref:hypothetical protein n=1 Tax=Tenacibaculum sp. HL-MS23 TaxID=3077734 RepID=UPI0028FC0D92|nr:hypothetical protein [Tenacibaculum sp. HL-MS23]WNW02745.1 hypothetical protein RRF68_04870 [Tenacibaculum sp. HL-MS23]